MPETVDEKALRCSFCGKNAADVQKLIAGENAFICNECVDVCNDILIPVPKEGKRKLLDVPIKGVLVRTKLLDQVQEAFRLPNVNVMTPRMAARIVLRIFTRPILDARIEIDSKITELTERRNRLS